MLTSGRCSYSAPSVAKCPSVNICFPHLSKVEILWIVAEISFVLQRRIPGSPRSAHQFLLVLSKSEIFERNLLFEFGTLCCCKAMKLEQLRLPETRVALCAQLNVTARDTEFPTTTAVRISRQAVQVSCPSFLQCTEQQVVMCLH